METEEKKKMHNFEELEVWKRSSQLAVSIIHLVEPLRLFGLKDQMLRPCISIPSDIAEAADRDSNREFRRFLSFPKGSAGELRTQLYTGIRAALVDEAQARPLIAAAKELSPMIEGLRKHLRPKLFNAIFGWFL